MSACYTGTLNVHSFPFTIGLKLLLYPQYQECYDRLHSRHYHELYFEKFWEMPLKVGYIFSLTMPVLFTDPCVTYRYHSCRQQHFSFHMLYYLSKSVNILQDWDLLHSYKNKTNSVRLLPVFAGFYQFFFHCPGKDTFCRGKNPTMN